jgi:hypothetical protein
MKAIILVICAALAVAIAAPSPRVVNGTDATIQEFPFMVKPSSFDLESCLITQQKIISGVAETQQRPLVRWIDFERVVGADGEQTLDSNFNCAHSASSLGSALRSEQRERLQHSVWRDGTRCKQQQCRGSRGSLPARVLQSGKPVHQRHCAREVVVAHCQSFV